MTYKLISFSGIKEQNGNRSFSLPLPINAQIFMVNIIIADKHLLPEALKLFRSKFECITFSFHSIILTQINRKANSNSTK